MIAIKRNKWFCLIAMFLVLCVNNTVSVFGENTKINGKLQIDLEAAESGIDLENVSFKVQKVANLKDGKYVLLEAYKKTSVDLNNLDSSEHMEMAANKLKEIDVNPDFVLKMDCWSLWKKLNVIVNNMLDSIK